MKTFRIMSALAILVAITDLAQPLTFSTARLPVGNGPTCVLPADLYGNGHVDLVTANFGYAPLGCIGSYVESAGSNLTAWINNGQGIFTSKSTIEIGGAGLAPYLQPEPEYVTAADLNGDGKTEMIEVNFYYNTILIITNNGEGGFAFTHSVIGGGRGPVFITVADVNGDGKPDIITVNNFDSTVTVITNAGNFIFSNSATLSTPSGPAWVAVGDFNGDGNPDLVCANYGSCGDGNTLTVFNGDGKGGFTTGATLNVGLGPACVVAADLTGNSRLDLISANQIGNSLSVLTNDGLGNFALKATIPISTPFSIVATNLAGPNFMDIACVNGNGSSISTGTVTVFTNDGQGNFGTNTIVPVGALKNSFYPDTIAAADFNGDGKVDLAVANYGAGSLTVLTQKTSGEKRPVVTITTPTNGSSFLTTEKIAVGVTASSAVSFAQLFVDNGVFAESVNAPYSFQISPLSLSPGSHTLQAVAVTGQNVNTFSSVVHITVNAPGTSLIDFDALDATGGLWVGRCWLIILVGMG